MAKHKVKTALFETEKTINQVDDTAEEELVSGAVTDCKKLRVRKQPSLDADILCEIACGSRVVIDEVQSTEEFYKVCTEVGIEGFCLKQYITINP